MALNMSVLTLCKFTPLGFETFDISYLRYLGIGCKFTPLGFETTPFNGRLSLPKMCKFTPLGFETIIV